VRCDLICDNRCVQHPTHARESPAYNEIPGGYAPERYLWYSGVACAGYHVSQHGHILHGRMGLVRDSTKVTAARCTAGTCSGNPVQTSPFGALTL